MAIDEALLLTCQQDKQADFFPTLRFYRWKIPTLSFGYSQRWKDTVDRDYCKRWGINIVRRLTGGRAVLHYKELTYSVVGRCYKGLFASSILETYRHISAALISGFNQINVPAQLVNPHLDRKSSFPNHSNKPCFFSASKYELAYQGKKLVGSAQKRLKNSFLQHGSILLEVDLDQLMGATGVDKSSSDASLIALNEVLGYKIGLNDLIEVLIEGVERYFSIKLIEGKLSNIELELAMKLYREKYSQSWWNFGR